MSQVPSAAATHVLLVEDDVSLAKSLKLALEHAGIRVRVAHNGLAASQLLRSATFDVLVTDYSLPGLSGRQLCAILRVHQTNIPIILITGQASHIEIARLQRENQLLAVFEKPVSPNELVQLVQESCPCGEPGTSA